MTGAIWWITLMRWRIVYLCREVGRDVPFAAYVLVSNEDRPVAFELKSVSIVVTEFKSKMSW